MRNKRCRTWIMTRKLKKKRGKCATNTVAPGIWRGRLKNVENEECTLQDLEYGDKTENHRK